MVNLPPFYQCPDLPTSQQKNASKSLIHKKGKPTVADVLSSILARLSLLINNRADSLEKMVGTNTIKIEGLKNNRLCICGDGYQNENKLVDSRLKMGDGWNM